MQTPTFSLYWALIIYGALLGLICLFPKSRQLYKKSFDFSVLKKVQTYLLIITAFLTIFFASLIIFKRSLSSTFNLLTSNYSQTLFLDSFELGSLLAGMLIIAPVFEELMFRVPLSIWMNRHSYFIFALLVSSIIFGMMHSEYPLFGVILGIVFGIVYRVTKSIVPGILVHFLWNLFSLYYFNYI